MSDFNYTEYLKNNPLLKKEEEKEDNLITESKQEVEEVEIPTASLTKINNEVKNVQTMAQAILDFIEQVKEKETVDFEANANMKIVLDKLNTLAKTEDKEVKNVAENEEEITKEEKKELPKSIADKEKAEIEKDAKKSKGMIKVSELKAKIKEDIISVLSEQDEEEEVEVEDEVEADIDIDEPAIDEPVVSDVEGLSNDEKEIQDSLKIAYDNAIAIGDTKLADQIGNSITFFTRTHVVER